MEKARTSQSPGFARIHSPARETQRGKTVQELRLVTDSLRQHAKGRDLILEMMRNHFKFLGRKDKMAAARTRPGEEGDGSREPHCWTAAGASAGRAGRAGREGKR